MKTRVHIIIGLLLAAFMLTGCLNYIKKRLPPPYEIEGGYQFQFEAPSATRVQLAGNWEWNDWLRGQAQTGSYLIGLMDDEDGDGIWTFVEDLPPGRYQYKFVIDQTTWKEDPNNPLRIDDGFGGFNSLLIVE